MPLSRRAFLKAAGVAGAAGMSSGVLPGPEWWPGGVAPAWAHDARMAGVTTLRRTIVRGPALGSGSAGTYYRLAEGPGEPHLLRLDLIPDAASRGRRFGDGKRSLLNFVHLTDARVTDSQSPARTEFLNRYGEGNFGGTYRPHELGTVQVLDAMIRQVRGVAVSPVSGKGIAFAMCTGNHVDNQQLNELRWFIDTMDGGAIVSPDSGGPGYEGVMARTWGDADYWHPGLVADNYKDLYGFPTYPSLVRKATAAFRPAGLRLPWYQTVGNHDGLVQGRVPRNPFYERVATGRRKLRGLPAGVSAPEFDPTAIYARLLVGEKDPANPSGFSDAPLAEVAADARRRILTRAQYVEEMFRSSGRPAGHGFTAANRPQEDGSLACYWHSDAYPHFRIIGLDTVNPGGGDGGSIGEKQLQWLEARLSEVSSRHYDASQNLVTTGHRDRYVVLFSNHGLASLNNSSGAPSDPLQLDLDDQPRHFADSVEVLIHRFPNVIAWVSGHRGVNAVTPRPDPTGRTGGFWDVATSGHVDWATQARLIDVVDNSNGTLSIFSTMVDHAGPAAPEGQDPVLRTASIARELASNNPRSGYDGGGRGTERDRNVELVIRAPFRLARPSSAPEQTGVPRG